MKWFPALLIPLAAINIFGAIYLILSKSGVSVGDPNPVRGLFLVLGIIVSVLAFRKLRSGLWLGKFVLGIGILAALFSLYLGVTLSSLIASVLSIVYILLYSLSIWVLRKQSIIPANA